MSPTGEFFVVWDSAGSGGTDDSLRSIQGRRFRADGTPVDTEVQVNTYTPSDQYTASISIGPTAEFVVVWKSNGSSATDDDGFSVQGRWFGADGLPVGDEFQLNSYTTLEQQSASVAVGPGGGFVTIWDSGGSSGTDAVLTGIQGQRFEPPGPPSPRGNPVDNPMTSANAARAALIAATDALAVLQGSVGTFSCDPCVCDVDDSGVIAATDALIVLRIAVGIPAVLDCPACT